MNVRILIPESIYEALRIHLFREEKEQGAFLFSKDSSSHKKITLMVEDIHPIESEGWDVQETTYLELNEEEKVKVMIMAKKLDCNLIECHSHRSHYEAAFSPSDIKGLQDFVSYVRWKLPGKNMEL